MGWSRRSIVFPAAWLALVALIRLTRTAVTTALASDYVKAARARGAAGGTVVTGTDLSLGADYHRELELLQGAGLAPWDVLRCATVNGAAFLGRTHDLGSLMPGLRG